MPIKKICFLSTDTSGLHGTQDNVSKNNLFKFARLVSLNYDIYTYDNSTYKLIKSSRNIVKPRCSIISEEAVAIHGLTQEIAQETGTDPVIVIKKFIEDMNDVNIIVSHSIKFHLNTIIAECQRYHLNIDFKKFLLIDTMNFYHSFGSLRLKDLATKLKIKKINDKSNVELIKLVFEKVYNEYKTSD
jgi:DNA polymerase III epsilon subunit-like protein